MAKVVVEHQELKLLTVAEVCMKLNVGRSTAFKLINQKGFPVIRIGKLIRIPESELVSWISRSVGSSYELEW
ncbi:helix-turn-helix domain-containing protein [Cohnella sp. CFH 77786]|uniref:helix-turn-helix domain-containing protein n=1 Tax=Cohnella sp. CFH 77786 TaxID=2662265 RepID=UPI001C608F2F|nr:helix-turn-helix domain-containing protein [Cohnella sp. CFH 77786]